MKKSEIIQNTIKFCEESDKKLQVYRNKMFKEIKPMVLNMWKLESYPNGKEPDC